MSSSIVLNPNLIQVSALHVCGWFVADPSLGLSAAEAKHPSPIDGLPDTRPRYIWLILVINASILVAAVFVAGVCCKKGGMSFVSTGAYGYVPSQ